jgi:fatty acid desaturase
LSSAQHGERSEQCGKQNIAFHRNSLVVFVALVGSRSNSTQFISSTTSWPLTAIAAALLLVL